MADTHVISALVKKELSYKNRILIRYIHDEIDEIEKEIS